MKNSRKIHKKDWLIIVFFVLAFYVLLPQIKSFDTSFKSVIDARPFYLFLAVSCTLLTYIFAAATYCILVPKKISYPKTILVQFASMFTNRLLPLGIGSISINYLYLRKLKFKSTQVASIIAANNIVGLIGHLLLLVVLYMTYKQAHLDFSKWHIATIGGYKVILIIGGLILVAVMTILFKKYLLRFTNSVKNSIKYLTEYRKQPQKIIFAVGTSSLLTLSNVLCLYFCCQAVQLSLNLLEVILIFSLGVFLGTATPTPGGLGGAEAGLFAGLLAFRVSSAQALATVLAFRLISFWLTFLFGSFAFIIAERLGYI